MDPLNNNIYYGEEISAAVPPQQNDKLRGIDERSFGLGDEAISVDSVHTNIIKDTNDVSNLNVPNGRKKLDVFGQAWVFLKLFKYKTI